MFTSSSAACTFVSSCLCCNNCDYVRPSCGTVLHVLACNPPAPHLLSVSRICSLSQLRYTCTCSKANWSHVKESNLSAVSDVFSCEEEVKAVINMNNGACDSGRSCCRKHLACAGGFQCRGIECTKTRPSCAGTGQDRSGLTSAIVKYLCRLLRGFL